MHHFSLAIRMASSPHLQLAAYSRAAVGVTVTVNVALLWNAHLHIFVE